jgi:RNA polymerase sigma-70 factor (ECF subfamily)
MARPRDPRRDLAPWPGGDADPGNVTVIAVADLEDEEVLAIWADTGRPRADRETAFHALVDRYEHRVHAICHRELRSRSDAEDATQDTFLHLARHAARFRGDSKLSTFVYRIAVNACRDLQRRQARRPQTPVADIEVARRSDDHEPDAAPDELLARETAMRVEQAMDALDPLSRTLLILCAIQGTTYPEAAHILDLPVGTIKSRVFRARARLAQLLEDEDALPPRGPARPRPDGVHGEPSAGPSPRGPPSG